MFETQSGGGQPFRKKRRYGFGDDDGTTPLPSNEYAALSQAMNDAPPEGVPQKRDFTLFQPVNAAALPPQMPQGVDNPPPPTDPALLQTSSALPENPQISTRPLAPLFEVKPVGQGGGGGGETVQPGNQPLKNFEPLQAPAAPPPPPTEQATLSPLEQARARYEAAVSAPVQKQGRGKQILFQALQAIGNIATGQGNKPIEWLGEAKHRVAVERAQRELAPLQAMEDQRLQDKARQAQIDNIYTDNRYQRDRLDEARQDRFRKEDDRKSRERTARMTQVAGMFKSLNAYDPADPKFAEITKALGDVDLPITPKDAKKKIDLKQDQRTGEWTTILTDPVTGKQEVRSVMKDGKVFASTPEVVMAGELGLTKQQDQQRFTADQNERDRQHQLKVQEIRQNFEREQKAIEIAQRDAQNAQTAEQRKEAEQRQEESRKRILDYQNQLQKEMYDYKQPKE